MVGVDIGADQFTVGDEANVAVEGWINGPYELCKNAKAVIDWSVEMVISPCGNLPPLDSGTTEIVWGGGRTIAVIPYTFPEVCPPESTHAGEPLVSFTTDRPVVKFDNISHTSEVGEGGGAALDYFEFVDGTPRQACPDGQATGDSGCGEPAGDPVNTLTGAFVYADRDFSMATRGGLLEVWRAYDSHLERDVGMGAGWSYAYSDRLVVEAGVKATWVNSQGASIVFPFQSGTAWKAPFGHTARLTQNADGTFTVKTGDLWSLTFSSGGIFTRATDRDGRQTTVTRDGSGRVAAVASSGRSLVYDYNPSGTLGTITAVGSNSGQSPAVTEFAYTGDRLSSVTKADGSQTLYSYGAGGRLSSIRDASTTAPQMQITYATDGRVTSQTDGNGKVTEWAWNSTTHTSTMTDPRGGEWKYVYADGYPVKQIDPTGITTTYVWNESGRLFRVSAPGGQRETFVYDSSDRLTKRIDSVGHVEKFSYTSTFRDPASQTDEAGRVTSFGYDTNRNLTTVTPPITSAKTTRGYAAGTFDLTSFKDPTQQTSTFTYDSTTGDSASITSPLGNKTTFVTDGFGRIKSEKPAPGNVAGASGAWATTVTRDLLGRVETITSPRGMVATYTYDAFGRVESEEDARGNVTAYAYDNAGHLTTITKPANSTQTFTYDASGNVATATDGRGHESTYGYDAANRMISLEREGREWQFTYDSAGRRESVEAPSGRTTTYDWNSRNFLTNIDYSDATPDVTIDYDSLGRRASVADGTGTWTYTYDNLDRPLTIAHGSDEWKYTWNAAGKLASRQAPGQQPTSYTYDIDGRLIKAARNGTDLATYSYDTANNSVTRTLANGAKTVETFARDGSLASSVEKNASATITHSIDYTRDLQGNPTKLVAADGETTIQQFDDRNRLTQICYETSTCTGATDFIRFAYDENNNITSEERPTGTITRTYDDHDQLTSEVEGAAIRSFEYDTDGNRTQDGDTTYTVNAAGHVTSSTTGATTTQSEYDASGLLRTSSTGGTTTKYDYDPLSAQLVGKRTGGTLTHQFVYGREAIAMTTTSGTDYYTTNELGSILATRDNTGGLQKSYVYEPYGVDRDSNGTGAASPLQFAGGLSLGDGDYRFGLRRYSAATATFSTPDPVDSGETYGYASGNPVVFTDPLGLSPITNALQDVGNIAGNAWHSVADPLLNNSVVQSAIAYIGDGLYAGGKLLSRALKTAGKFVWDNRATIGFAICVAGPLSAACIASIPALVFADALQGGINAQKEGESFFSGAGREGAISGAWALGGLGLGRGLRGMYAAQYGDDFLKSGGLAGAPPSFSFHLVNLPLTGLATSLQYGSTH
jgi:RHS repeat-associated protein